MSAERRTPCPLPIRLLLIDENRDDHQLVCDLLDDVADTNFAIDWANDLAVGRDLLEDRRFDICLLDHQFPDGDGLSLIDTAKVRGIDTPMIVLASQGSVELDRRAMALGASGYLDKDRLDPMLLERTIRYALQQRRIVCNLSDELLRDSATGLVTPVLFQDRLARALAAAKRRQTVAALVLIGLGDDQASPTSRQQRLNASAKILTDQLRETDTVAGLSSDRLALILEDLRKADDAALVVLKMLDRLTASADLENGRSRSAPCAGIALYPDDCGDVSSMLRQAEAAMRRAKTDATHKHSAYRFSSNHSIQNMHRRFVLSGDLKRALGQQALALRYRPLVHITGKTISLSAEVYWKGQDKCPILRDQFQAIADDRPLVGLLTNWLIGEAVSQLSTWQKQGLGRVDLSLPAISARPHDLPILERSVCEHLADARIAADQLEIDLGQELLSGDFDLGCQRLSTLKATGVRLALDEFGRNNTSFEKLAVDVLDGLKLSSELYRDLPGNPASETFLKAIINLGHDLELKVVANGTRDERQFAFLKSVGCDAIKLCAPDSLLTADMFTIWLQKSSPLQTSQKAGPLFKTQVSSPNRKPDAATIKMDINQPLSSTKNL